MRWPRRFPQNALTAFAVDSEVRTVRGAASALPQRARSPTPPAGAIPAARDTTEGVPIVAARSERHEPTRISGFAGDGERGPKGPCDRRRASHRSWSRRGGTCDSDYGRRRLASLQVKAAPAQQVRVVHRARRRKAPALEVPNRVSPRRGSNAAIAWPEARPIEAGRMAKCPTILPTVPEPRERNSGRAKDTHAVRIDARLAPCAHHGNEPPGPKRPPNHRAACDDALQSGSHKE